MMFFHRSHLNAVVIKIFVKCKKMEISKDLIYDKEVERCVFEEFKGKKTYF